MLGGSLVQAVDKLLNHLKLVGLDGYEEVAEREVADHHVLEDPRLGGLQALDEGRRPLKQLVDVLVSCLLFPQRQPVPQLRYY